MKVLKLSNCVEEDTRNRAFHINMKNMEPVITVLPITEW